MWDDAPAMPMADPAIINDLDLITGVSDAEQLAGNFKQTLDRRNTIEHTIWENPRPGATYYVNVSAHAIPQVCFVLWFVLWFFLLKF